MASGLMTARRFLLGHSDQMPNLPSSSSAAAAAVEDQAPWCHCC